MWGKDVGGIEGDRLKGINSLLFEHEQNKVENKPNRQDRDKDGIEDKKDICPDCFGQIENFGCDNIIYKIENQRFDKFIILSGSNFREYNNMDSIFILNCAHMKYIRQINQLLVNNSLVKHKNVNCTLEFDYNHRSFIIDEKNQLFIRKKNFIKIGFLRLNSCAE